MRTSLNEIRDTENFHFGNLKAEESLLFKAKLLLDPFLRLNMLMQTKAYSLIKLYARKKLRAEIGAIQEKIFHDPEKRSFREKVIALFLKS